MPPNGYFLNFWPGSNQTPRYQHIQTCQPGIVRCARALVISTVHCRNFDALARRRARAARCRRQTRPPDIKTADTCRTHIRCRTDQNSDLSSGKVRRSASRYRAYPRQGIRKGRTEKKYVDKRLFASGLRCAVYALYCRLTPESPYSRAAGRHLLGVCLAARKRRHARGQSLSQPYQGRKRKWWFSGDSRSLRP